MKSGGTSYPNPLSSPPRWCSSDLLRSFEVCSDAKERVRCGKQREATAPIQSLVKLQPWFLSLQWITWLRQNCSLGSCACSEGPVLEQNTLIMMMTINKDYSVTIFKILRSSAHDITVKYEIWTHHVRETRGKCPAAIWKQKLVGKCRNSQLHILNYLSWKVDSNSIVFLKHSKKKKNKKVKYVILLKGH